MTRFRLYLYGVLLLLLATSFILWRFSSLSDFGGNLFSELIGIVITVSLIDVLLQKIKEEEQKSLTVSAYIEVRQLVNRYVNFVGELFRFTVDEEMPTNIKDLLTDENISKIWDDLDINEPTKPTPFGHIVNHFEYIGKRNYDDGSKILNRHGWHLDPLVYKHIHTITESMFTVKLSLKQFSGNLKYDQSLRPKIIKYHFIPPASEDLDSLFKLYTWCQETHKANSKKYKLLQSSGYRPDSPFTRELFYKKDPTVKERELQQWQEYLKEQTPGQITRILRH